MGLFDRISRVFKSNLNDLVSKAEDPEKMLEQALLEMQEDLVQLRQAVAGAIAGQKRTQQQYEQNLSQMNHWEQRAKLALQKGDENLAREALTRKKANQEASNSLKIQLDAQTTQVDGLRRSLSALEGKISEAKTKKDMLKVRYQAAKAQEQLTSTLGNLGSSSSPAAFERMEEKVLQMEARSQAAGELAGADLESQFKALEGGSDIDDELSMLKAQISGTPEPLGALPGTTQSTQAASTSNPSVDAEMEELRRHLENLD